MAQQHHVFGIRHHGPGSARALLNALNKLQPDCVLVEGPPDANDLLHWAGHAEMEPPVALLIYRPDQPSKAAFYPYADFSAEFQAIRYAVERSIPVHFIDLPVANRMATDAAILPPNADVMQQLGAAAGYGDYEQWWNAAIEQRRDTTDLFDGILDLMTLLRASAEITSHTNEGAQLWADRREAAMRNSIRAAIANGYQRIAVVVGAWHAPALIDLNTHSDDDILLDGLAAVTVTAAWAPWTYGRLAARSGYGAGIRSPGWYDHLWQMGRQNATPAEASMAWLSRASALLREAGFDTSAAHVIEATRLAEAVAVLRDLPFPGLPELNEAIQTVMCGGDVEQLTMIRTRLTIGDQMGAVPSGVPLTPLQRDLRTQQRRLRLRPDPTPSKLKLDLRHERHRERSYLLHRLNMLNVPWGKMQRVRSKQGTYAEVWQLTWQPGLVVRIIEATIWGNTVMEAADAVTRDSADKATDLPTLTKLLDDVILADLPETVLHIMARIEEQAAISSDVPHMMDALPPLARILRYGDVRQTDQNVVEHVVDGLLTRICVGLPSTARMLDDKAAADLLTKIDAVHAIVTTLRNTEHEANWHEALATIADDPQTHGLLAGRASRLLLDSRFWSRADAALRIERALSADTLSTQDLSQLMQAATWLEGFLQGSELLIIHDRDLWQLLDDWITQLHDERFLSILPLLRRTFSSFSEAARAKMHDRVRAARTRQETTSAAEPRFDYEQARTVLPLVAQLLGVSDK
ncbi:MAG: DUF5682 family protein [Anaerolineae bacterium]|nr:DUF5682 family protein [Anaerolineae bacterium]